jgi:hypothetical protein
VPRHCESFPGSLWTSILLLRRNALSPPECDGGRTGAPWTAIAEISLEAVNALDVPVRANVGEVTGYGSGTFVSDSEDNPLRSSR